MSFKFTNAIKKLIVGNSTAKAVLYQLGDHANDAGTCYPSINCLSKETEFTDRAIKTAIALLEKKGFICVTRTKGKGNKYKLLIEINNSASKNIGEITTLPDELASPGGVSDSHVLVKEMHTNHNNNNLKIIKNHHSFNKENKTKNSTSRWANKKYNNKIYMDHIDINFFNSIKSGE